VSDRSHKVGDGWPRQSQEARTTRVRYRAEAVREDDRWHLQVSRLDSSPERGDVDALVVTLPQRETRFPATALHRQLTGCGFELDGDWARSDGEDRWTATCRLGGDAPGPPVP
jgi:hypothetical protein